MRLGIIANNIEDREPMQSSTLIALSACNRDHEVWFLGVGELALDVDGSVHGWGVRVPRKRYKSPDIFLAAVKQGERARVDLADLDVVMLRFNPVSNESQRGWGAISAMMFAGILTRSGTIVVNDPSGLQSAATKMYLHLFPSAVVPRSLITRERKDIRDFLEQEGRIVLKPLQGSGGHNVFIASTESLNNLNQIIDAISRDGYIIAQEYLPAASEGDLRMFLMNGKPLKTKGRYAAVRRRCGENDIRSNVHAGGYSEPGKVEESHLRIAEIVRPKLVQDGMFLVGLDIVGDKLVELNVFSPGGLHAARRYEGVNFFATIVADLERKVRSMQDYRRSFSNREMAIL